MSSITELLGGLLILLGLFTRPAAFAVMINISVATFVTLPKGFIMVVGVAAYPFTLFICSIIVQLAGPLKYSLDSLLFHPNEFIDDLNYHDKPIISLINKN